MGIRLNRTKDKPPRLDIQFRTWDEWDAYQEHAEEVGGKMGPLARVELLRNTRLGKPRERVNG